MRLLIPISLVMLLSGCGATALTAGGQSVKVQKSDPPPGCEEVGFLEGRSSNLVANYKENARNKLRNQAAERGANYLRLESEVVTGNGVAYEATAYKCK